MNQQINQPLSGTCTGTALVLLMQISHTEVLKTVLLATLGALVSFLVSLLLKKLQNYFFRRR